MTSHSGERQLEDQSYTDKIAEHFLYEIAELKVLHSQMVCLTSA